MIRIATILTVFNRREKTLACLRHLYEALQSYQQRAKDQIGLTVFLTDDGCTDGTAEAIRKAFSDKDVHILQGTGSLYWAGGMRLAWQAAIDSGIPWDYNLLLNDDTNIFHHAFDELFEADTYGYHQTGKHGLSSGITCQPGHPDDITYGGFRFEGNAKGCHSLALPTGKPAEVDMTHANILLVHSDVVADNGIFYKGYIHSAADEDYSLMARQKGYPTIVTAHVCGECECDHSSKKGEIEQLAKMSLAERKKYVRSPLHSDHDYLLYVRRNMPLRYPIALVLRTLRLYCPKLYYRISKFRGVYKHD